MRMIREKLRIKKNKAIKEKTINKKIREHNRKKQTEKNKKR